MNGDDKEALSPSATPSQGDGGTDRLPPDETVLSCDHPAKLSFLQIGQHRLLSGRAHTKSRGVKRESTVSVDWHGN